MNKKKIYCFIGFMLIIYKYLVMVINYNTMQNTQENSPPAIPSNLKPVSKLLRMLSQIPIRPPVREQLSTPVYALHIVLTLILYLSTKQINLLPLLFKVDNELVVIILLSTLLIIIIQCVIAVLYNKQFFLKLQFMIYVYILYPIAIYFLLGFTGWQRLQAKIALAITVVISAIFTLLLQAFIGKQCYSSHLIVDTGLPLNFYIFLFSLSHYLFACTSDPYQLLAILLMTLFSVYTKIGLVDRGFRRCKSAEYTLVRVQASLNLLYTSFILVQWISDSNHTESQPYIFIIPLVIFLIISEFMGQYADLMSPFTSDFFRQSDNKQKFLECAQYISDDLKLTNSTKNSQNIIKTCLIPLYYSHLKNCNPSFCRLSHELQPSVLSSLGNYKSLTKAAFNIIQMLFLHFLELYHNDIELRIAFLNFYSLWGQSNARMMQLLAQTQMSQLSLTQQIKLYQIKKCFGGGQMGDQTKVQDSCLGFNQNITSLMKLLIQFWSQFIEQRIDFQKVLQLSQKITPIMNNLQNQIEQTLKLETYSSIKILRVYSEYCRWILNDDVKSATVSDYTSFLTKKIAQVNEINSIAADMEIGLIAISLNFRKIGEIKIANSQAANIFNYNKQEFLKVNVNTLMPSLISKHHDDYLKAFISYSGRKVNTDRRLLLGKKKQNFIFQIYLQLQKSVITHTDELVFIANIELAKIKEAVILIVCDDKGLITDYNSTYYEIFQKVYKKGKKSEQKRYGNIQQLITNFFSIVLTQSQQPKSSIECFDNPVFGIIQIKFEIVKLSVKQKKDMGYIIKGYRIYETKQTFFNSLNISNELIEKSDERDLKGMKIQYSSASNQYHFNESLDIFNCGQFHSDFTIPYVKLEMLGSLITQKVEENYLPQYDTDIKTLRFFGDHFQRVQEIDSFQSEISEEEKANSKKNRFLIIKQKILSEKKNLNNKLPQALSLLLLTVNLIILIFFYITVSQEKGQIFTKTKQISEAYEFRAKLSEYIIYFQAQNDLTYGNFFKNNKEMLKSQLINDITSANLTQSQKQKALKVVYLQETLKNTTFQQLINDDVLYIQKDDQPLVQNKFVIFKVLFGIVLGLRLLANFIIMQWHKKKIINTFSLFLGLTEGEIKFSQQKCLKFLKHSNQSEKASNEQVEYEQVEDQNPHVKIKKFKNSSLLCQSSNWLKLNAFVFIFLAFFILVLVNDWKMSSQFETDKASYDFVFTVMPEYSTVLMKIYSQKKQNINLEVKEHFFEKYQAIDFNLLTFTNQKDASEEQEKFMKIMMSDQCLNSSYMLPNSLRCQQVCNNIMKGGISKATNYLAHRLNNLKKQSSSSAISQLNELSLLLYHLMQPKLKTISSRISQKLQSEQQLTNIFIMLYLIVMLTLSVSDAVYQHNYPLEEIQKNIVDSKILIGLLPEVKKKNKKGYTAL